VLDPQRREVDLIAIAEGVVLGFIHQLSARVKLDELPRFALGGAADEHERQGLAGRLVRLAARRWRRCRRMEGAAGGGDLSGKEILRADRGWLRPGRRLMAFYRSAAGREAGDQDANQRGSEADGTLAES